MTIWGHPAAFSVFYFKFFSILIRSVYLDTHPKFLEVRSEDFQRRFHEDVSKRSTSNHLEKTIAHTCSYGPFNGESLVKVGYRSSKMKHKPLWPAIRPFTKTSKYRFCVLWTAILLPHVIPTEGYGCRTFTKKLCTQSRIAPMGWPSPKEFFQPLLHTVYTISITELAFTTPSSTEQRKKTLNYFHYTVILAV